MQTQDNHELTKSKKPHFSLLNMDQWSELIKQWDKTKETQKTYCKRLNLNINTFSYVKAKLHQKKQTTKKFIPVTIQSGSPIIREKSYIIFENHNGIKLTLPLSTKEDELLYVLKLIGWSHA